MIINNYILWLCLSMELFILSFKKNEKKMMWEDSNWEFKYRNRINGKLQITSLKFGDVWILYFEISEVRFYSLKSGTI